MGKIVDAIRGVFKRKPVIPGNIFDRVGFAAVEIYLCLDAAGLYEDRRQNKDGYLWENMCYIMATLRYAGLLSEEAVLKIRRKVAISFNNEVMARSYCFVWMSTGVEFYFREVRDIATGKHGMPDVVVYNLSQASYQNRKRFDDLPIEGIDVMKIMLVWTRISDLMGKYFFRKGEDISALPLGA